MRKMSGSQQLETKIREAKNNEEKLEMLIREYEFFILSSAANIAKHHVSKSDDEWSIALMAFYDAIKSFDNKKGNFLSYAKLLIKSRLIDYFRSQGKHSDQISIDLVAEHELASEQQKTDAKYEIEALEQTLKKYEISFSDLTESSPKAKKTKKACKTVIRFLLASSLLVADIQRTQMLPNKIIEEKTKVPRKIIERHRKYIVTAVEILTGDYPHLCEYLAYVVKEEEP